MGRFTHIHSIVVVSLFRHCHILAYGLVLLLLLSAVRAESTYLLQPEMPMQLPGESIEVLKDPLNKFALTHILAGNYDPQFEPLAADRGSVGVNDATWWVRFEVENSADTPITWVMNFPAPLVDSFDFYQMENGHLVESYRLGDRRPIDLAPIPSEGFAGVFTTPPGTTSTIYVRIQNMIPDILDLQYEVGSPTAHAQKQQFSTVFLGMVLGGCLALFIYNMMVYFVVRDSVYLWYLCYLLNGLLTFLAVSGLGLRYVWGNIGIWSEGIPAIGSAVTFALVVQFSRKFLATKERYPRVDPLMRVWIILLLVPAFAFLMGYSGLAATLNLTGCMALSLLLILGINSWRKGYRPARIFTIGWGLWFASIGALAARAIGLAPTNEYTIRIAWVGLLLEALFFSLALVDRLRLLQEQKEAAEERERRTLQRSRDELESLVQERTQELATRKAELERANNEKDKFFSIIAHDLRGPLYGVVGMADLLHEQFRAMPESELQSCIEDLRKSASGAHALLENL
ncbi:MAG: 7TM diverse intracellular signaling domain-containing protein, partial [Puniceicoccales bacterium]